MNMCTKPGFEWVRIIRRIAESPVEFSSDKRRFGWMIRQKRADRLEMAMLSIALFHNIFTVRVKQG
ncbi:MAG: hypothetical protein V3R93_06965 [Candidatus Hydrothermarchaeaceae archaeon]